jgi:hypothetical protein
MSKNVVEPERPQIAIWWRVACCISKATRAEAHTQKYVILLFHCHSDFVYASQCYVTRTVRVLFFYSRITSTEFPSFCMITFSASLTNLTVRLRQSHDYSCYVSRPILAPPPLWLQKHTDLRARDFAHFHDVSSAYARYRCVRLKLECFWNYCCYTASLTCVRMNNSWYWTVFSFSFHILIFSAPQTTYHVNTLLLDEAFLDYVSLVRYF